MPNLDTTLHLDMLRRAKEAGKVTEDAPYGMNWGDPEEVAALTFVRRLYLDPFVAGRVIEIGPGGGRWTQYLLSAEELYAVDYHQELLDELAKNFAAPNLHFVKNDGTDFPGIPDASIDFVFSFGVFVHLSYPLIDAYLAEIKRVLKPNGHVSLQYSDKRKKAAHKVDAFDIMTPDLMRAMVHRHGFEILSESNDLLPHSAVVHFSADPTYGKWHRRY